MEELPKRILFKYKLGRERSWQYGVHESWAALEKHVDSISEYMTKAQVVAHDFDLDVTLFPR